jgi:hypothetical protein
MESERQSEKHVTPIDFTGDGMEIAEREKQYANAALSITVSLEPGSNVTVDRSLHCEKHRAPSVTTEAGITIDESDEHS